MKLIFEIAGIGIVTSLLSIMLESAGKKDIAMLLCMAGTIASVLLIANVASELLSVLKGLS